MAGGTGVWGGGLYRGVITAFAVAGTAWSGTPTTRAAPGDSCGVVTGVGAAGTATAEEVVDLARGLRQPTGGSWEIPIDRERPAKVGIALFALG